MAKKWAMNVGLLKDRLESSEASDDGLGEKSRELDKDPQLCRKGSKERKDKGSKERKDKGSRDRVTGSKERRDLSQFDRPNGTSIWVGVKVGRNCMFVLCVSSSFVRPRARHYNMEWHMELPGNDQM